MPVRSVLLLMAASQVFGAEYAVLATGFRIRAERLEKVGALVRLYGSSGACTEVAASEVVAYEKDDYVPPPPAPASAPAPPPAAAPLSIPQMIDRAAERHGLPRELIHGVAKAESGYRQDAVSPKGALGVMQLMPATAAALGADPTDPEQNIEAGTRLLSDLLVKYNGSPSLALAAYNAGSGAVDRHGDVPPYRETRTYVERVLRDLKKSPPR